jgi:Zn-finger protein
MSWGSPQQGAVYNQYVVDHIIQLHDIHHFTHEHVEVASDWMKTHYNCPTYSTEFQDADIVWLYCPNGPKESHKSHKYPRRSIHTLSDVVCQIHQHPMVKTMMIHMDRLMPHLQATQNE